MHKRIFLLIILLILILTISLMLNYASNNYPSGLHYSCDKYWVCAIAYEGHISLAIRDNSTPSIRLPRNNHIYELGCEQDHLFQLPEPKSRVGPPIVHHGMEFNLDMSGRFWIGKY